MQCPSCKARLPTNLDFPQCPRCGRPLTAGAKVPEVSSPSLKLDLADGYLTPARVLEGIRDAVELTFTPRVAWERAALDTQTFLGRKAPVALASLLLTTLGALATSLVMHLVGHRFGVGDYVAARTWSWVMVALVPVCWLLLGVSAHWLGRKLTLVLMPASGDASQARQVASRVAIMSAAPALGVTGAAALWLVADVGPVLCGLCVLYALHSTFVGIWRGAGLLLDLDPGVRNRLAFTLALPLTALYALCGAGGLVILMLQNA